MKFRSFVYSLLVCFDVTIYVRSQSQPTCITGERAKKFTNRMVKEHNKYRALHDVPLLVADNTLTQGSIDWSKELASTGKWEHSPNPGHKYGENLYAQSINRGGIDESSLNPVKPWYDEIKYYRGGFSAETGHYTQVVWKSTKQVGCGVCAIDTRLIITCRYGPPGNFHGEFEKNVLPPRRTKNNPIDTLDENPSSETPMTDETDDTDNTEFDPEQAHDNLKIVLVLMTSTLFILGLIVLIILSVIIYYYVMNHHNTCI